MVAKCRAPFAEAKAPVAAMLKREREDGLDGPAPYKAFKERIFQHREELRSFVENARRTGRMILGYGASTKGNVILQFCGFSEEDIPFIGEVNREKIGCYTPGTVIPIISEDQARMKKPDYFMVLPWHFRENIILREAEYLQSGGRLFFPLPVLEVVVG